MEMAVLVAVSIPIFTRQLEKSREATDRANLRAAKAAVVSAILDGQVSASGKYDAVKGLLVKSDETVKPYGKGTALKGTDADDDYETENVDYTNAYIIFSIDAKGIGTIDWSGATGSGNKKTITVGGDDMFNPTT
ncbi:MAG: hypothetical protein J6D53_08265 [Blautia sp.]|nr:hypothetical protein [Blautia sp.]